MEVQKTKKKLSEQAIKLFVPTIKVVAVFILIALIFIVTLMVLFPGYDIFFKIAFWSFAFFQVVSVINFKRRHLIFKYLDYIYYLVIGGAVSLGTIAIQNQSEVKSIHDANLKETLQVKLIEIKHLETIKSEMENIHTELKRNDFKFCYPIITKNINPLITYKYKAQELFGGTVTDSDKRMVNMCVRYSDLSREYYSSEYYDQKYDVIPSTSIEAQMQSVEESSHNEYSLHNDEDKKNRILYLYLPSLLVFGISIKLGKTTESIATKPNN